MRLKNKQSDSSTTRSEAVAMVADHTCLHPKDSKCKHSFLLTYITCECKPLTMKVKVKVKVVNLYSASSQTRL